MTLLRQLEDPFHVDALGLEDEKDGIAKNGSTKQWEFNFINALLLLLASIFFIHHVSSLFYADFFL